MANLARDVESLGRYAPDVEETLSKLDTGNIVARIWQNDHRVWKADPTEIADRLGWLTVTDTMQEQLPRLASFAADVRDAGYRHVVLLGMGGSSLAPEVLRRTFSRIRGNAAGFPELLVLDSTLPAWVQAVDAAIDPAKTLFLVSSKSGSTIEPNTLYAHFRQQVVAAKGEKGEAEAGQNFAAVTDPGTVLERLAGKQGFRQAFLNPPEIGGRYSALSYFGLVPAALIGLDLDKLLDRADAMREDCAVTAARDNPGAWLGAVMGILARRGRDKLTLVTSSAIAGFGLWVEQLLAESLGKESTGIIPIAGEPPFTSNNSPDNYGPDRLFVYLRLEDDDNGNTDAAMESVAATGQPVVRLDLKDRYDLGAEFYRWEFATAVAGSLLGVHPFDQPDVQGAKDMTDRMLEQYRASGALPAEARVDRAVSAGELLSLARPGDYLAILAYLPDTPELSAALDLLRRRVAEKYGIPTTAGFGPRYLHSTGQLHKGGPNSGLYLQLTADHGKDIPIPGRPYTFGVLADAQAAGDLQALQNLGRRTARVHLGADPAAGLEKVTVQIR